MKRRAIHENDTITFNGEEMKDLSRYEVEYSLPTDSLYLHVLFDDERKAFTDNLKSLFRKQGRVEFIHSRDGVSISHYVGVITSIRKVFGFDYIEAYTVKIEINEN